jgi:hypothetical protein
MRLIQFAVFAFSALAPAAAFAQSEAAATVSFLSGNASAGTAGAVRALAKGETVYAGDTVSTGSNSYASLHFTDQGSVVLRPNSQFTVEQYHYAGGSSAPGVAASSPPGAAPPAAAGTVPESSFLRLVKGSFRAVSGLIGRISYDRYRVDTPVMTMGIRGTDYELAMCEQACASDPNVIDSLPKGVDPSGGVVSGDFSGEIHVVSSTGKSMTLTQGQYGITLPNGDQYMLKGRPGFLSKSDGLPAGTTGLAAYEAKVYVGIFGVVAATAGALLGTGLGEPGPSSGTTGTTSTTSTTSTAPAR